MCVQLLPQKVLHKRPIGRERFGLNIVRLGQFDFLFFLLALHSILVGLGVDRSLLGRVLRLKCSVLFLLRSKTQIDVQIKLECKARSG